MSTNEKGTPQSRTYTVNDIAAILGIGRASAYKLANSGFVEESNLLVLNKLERLLTGCFKPKENYTRSELLKVNEK